MKLKNLMFLLAIGLFVASCTDKKSAEELAKLKVDMRKADSICMADKTMLMDSIAMINMRMDSMMALLPAPKNTTGTKSTTSTKTTTTTKGTDVMDSKGKSTQVDMSTKGKSEEKVDMKTKGKSSNSGGN